MILRIQHRSFMPCPRGFSLVELLVVIGIIIALIGLITPTIVPLMRSWNVTKSAAMVTDELNAARQVALTQNRDVEIRFYQRGSSSDSPASPDAQIIAFGTFMIDPLDPAKIKPLGKIEYLPNGIIISANPTFSSLLDYANPNRAGIFRESQAAGALPRAPQSTSYIRFRFRATGGTDLLPISGTGSTWFLTLFLQNAKVNASTGLPSNYFTAQLDPVTGRVRTYRP